MSDVIPFPSSPRPFSIFTPGRLSSCDPLVPLYERAIAAPALVDDNRQEFERLLREGRTVRRVAVDPGGVPVGLAVAAPVSTFRDLASVLGVDRVDAHVPTIVSREKAWALLVASGPFEVRRGVGRALANAVLDSMRGEPCTRLYVAVRTGTDHWLHVRLLATGFSRDGITKDGKRVVLSRKTEGFAF